MRFGIFFSLPLWPALRATSSVTPSKMEELGSLDFLGLPSDDPAPSPLLEWSSDYDLDIEHEDSDRSLEVFGPCVGYDIILEPANSLNVQSFGFGTFEFFNNQTTGLLPSTPIPGNQDAADSIADVPDPLLGIDHWMPHYDPEPSLEFPSAGDYRKRKNPQNKCLISTLIGYPDLDLDSIVSLLGGEIRREAVNRIMNLRRMPVTYMEVIERMMQENPLVKPSNVVREIRKTAGPVPVNWISIWMRSCMSWNQGNVCREKVTITLNDNSRMECFFMDSSRWVQVLKFENISNRAGVDFEAGFPPSQRRRTAPNLPDRDIHDIVVASLQANLRSSAARILDTISQAGGNSDLATIVRIKNLIERKFVAPVWFHNYLLMNPTAPASKILTSLVRARSISEQERIDWDFVLTDDKISEWRRFCIAGNAELIHNRCREIRDPRSGQVTVHLTNDQKRALLATL